MSPTHSELLPSELSSERREQVLAGLERILASPEFRSSQRSVEFLRYVVLKWLDKDFLSLREKSIATAVFAKPSSYDPAQDSFVRVKASELRKRLAAFYEGSGRAESLVIELPLGTYQPLLHWRNSALAPPPVLSRSKLYFALLVGFALVCLAYFAFRTPDPLASFWSPFTQGPQPVLISLPVLPRYEVSGQVLQALRKAAPTTPVPVLPDQIWPKDEVVGMGAGIGTAHLTALFARLNLPFTIKAAKDVHFSDLRRGPAILLGGFSSAWTVEEMKDWRFRMNTGPPGRILDTVDSEKSWIVEGFRRNGRADRDFALVTRVVDSGTGQTLLALSGITTFGTQSAAEFVTRPENLATLFALAPASWSGRNLQVVLSMRIKDDAPGPPHIEATHFW